MKFISGCLFLLSFLSFNIAHAGGSTDFDNDLVLSGIIDLTAELSDFEEREVIRLFADRLFTSDSDEGNSFQGKTYQTILDQLNKAIKHTDSQLSCDRRQGDLCFINGHEIDLSHYFYDDSWSLCTSNTIKSATGFIVDVASNKLIHEKHKQVLINNRFVQLSECEYQGKELSSNVAKNEITSAYYVGSNHVIKSARGL